MSGAEKVVCWAVDQYGLCECFVQELCYVRQLGDVMNTKMEVCREDTELSSQFFDQTISTCT